MCTMGSFWQLFNEFTCDVKGIDLILFERLDIIVQDSQIENLIPKYDSARIIRDAEKVGSWGFCNKGYQPTVAEIGLWSQKAQYMDVLVHELNHVDHAALTRLYKEEYDEEHIVMIHDERLKEVRQVLAKIPDALVSRDEHFVIDTSIRRWVIGFY